MFKRLGTNVTLKCLSVTRVMNSSQVSLQVTILGKRSAAHVALDSGVRILWRAWAGVALSMRRVVVSADR